MKFYKCNICGNIVAFVEDKGNPIFCCGQPMEEIIPGTVDASKEKHVPVYEVKGNTVTVKVGSTPHPMTEEHLITWIALETKFGNQRKELKANDKPETSFAMVDGDEVKNVYAYCNLHGLWKA
ncbi:MAG: desulfoferrodoxin family protein [Christensenellales bacterium]